MNQEFLKHLSDKKGKIKNINGITNNEQQAGAELGQAQPQLGLEDGISS